MNSCAFIDDKLAATSIFNFCWTEILVARLIFRNVDFMAKVRRESVGGRNEKIILKKCSKSRFLSVCFKWAGTVVAS